jgi:soluble lytic murein transglycosylase-like protein
VSREQFIIAGAAIFTAALVLLKKANPVAFADMTAITIDAFSNATQSTEQAATDAVETARTMWQLPEKGIKYWPAIRDAASKSQIPPILLARLLYEESRFRSDIISGKLKSKRGAVGIAQFLPATAAELHVDPYNPNSSIDGAARYLRQLYDQFGTWALALTAYNWGEGNLTKKGVGAAPAETVRYVDVILTDANI